MSKLWNNVKDVLPREKKFCERCGHKLEDDTRITGYDPYTGAPERPFNGQKVCSNRMCFTRSSAWG